MALSSQMAVADIRAEAGGVIKDTATGSIINSGTTVISSGKLQNISAAEAIITNATIINGTIVNADSYVRIASVNGDGRNGSIINGWNFRDGGNGTLGNNGTVVVGSSFGPANAMPISVLIGKAGDLLIDSGVVVRGISSIGGNGLVVVGQNVQVGTITNKGTLTGSNKNINVGNYGVAEAIVNEGVINANGAFGIMGWANSTIKTIINKGTISGNGTNGLIGLSDSDSEMLLVDGGVLNTTNNSTSAISIINGTTVDNFTITNGGSIKGKIDIRGASNVGTMVISGANNSGTATQITGNINIANTSTITNGISLSNSANITGTINLTEQGYIDTLSLNQGTITGGISLTGNGTGANANNRTATIESITLENTSTITGDINIKGNNTSNNAKIGTITLESGTGIGGSIVVGNNTAKGTIDTITLNGNASVGGITGNNGIISTLTLGGTSSIGTITNNSNGTITNIALNENGTITNGITNASGGTISNITLASSNTIHTGITNNGNIGEITSNLDNINNIITNSGTINDLVVSKGTITYVDNNGVVDSLLQVENGATLKMGASGNGTITIGSDLGSVLDLKQGSTFEGNLKNASAIKEWKNDSNIRGSFINASGASVGDLIAGEIRDNLLNEGEITNLTINEKIGTLTNSGSITALAVEGTINNGIANEWNHKQFKYRFFKFTRKCYL